MRFTSKGWLMFAVLLMFVTLQGCGFETVPPAHKGKILTTSGYSDEVLPPAKYTLWGRDKMILLETNTATYKETVNVILSDKLTLTVEVRFRGRIAGTTAVVNSMFDDVIAGADDKVSFNEVYGVYGKMAVRNRTRDVIRVYTVEDVHKNYGRISKEVGAAIQLALKGTPIEVSDVALGSIQYPKIVTQAVEDAKARTLSIKKEEAQAIINMLKKTNELALVEADYQIEMKRAKTVKDANVIMGQGITRSLLKLKALKVQEKMATNGAAVFVPYDAIGSIGVNNRMYSK